MVAKSQVVEQPAGRYTLEQAAQVLEREADERFETVLDRLVSAAKSGELRMQNPAENFRRDYTAEKTKQVRIFYEEAYWDDLNSWLEANEPRVQYKFPAPELLDELRPQRKGSAKDRDLYAEALEAFGELMQTDVDATFKRILAHLESKPSRWKATASFLASFSAKGWEKALSRAGGIKQLRAEARISLRG